MKYFAALFRELGFEVQQTLRVDSSSAIGVASRRGLQRLRHLDVRYLWLQGEVAEKRLALRKCRGDENLADMGTKPVDKETLQRCRVGLRLRAAPTSLWTGGLVGVDAFIRAAGADYERNPEAEDDFAYVVILGLSFTVLVLATAVFFQARALARRSREDADKREEGSREDEDEKTDDEGKKENEQQQQRMQRRSAGRVVGPSGSIGEPQRFHLTARGARVHLFGDCRALVGHSAEAREMCRLCARRAAGV